MSVTQRRLGSTIVAALLLSGCGSFQPFATPFVSRPALPPGDPWPMDAEAVVERLETLGYLCDFEPDSDIPGGWHCDGVEGVTVGLGADQEGAVLSAGARMFDEAAPGKDVMDRRAVIAFSDHVLAALLPDAVLPSDDELLTMVQRNWPVELGDGWILGFDRASNQRTLHVRYVEPAADG